MKDKSTGEVFPIEQTAEGFELLLNVFEEEDGLRAAQRQKESPVPPPFQRLAGAP